MRSAMHRFQTGNPAVQDCPPAAGVPPRSKERRKRAEKAVPKTTDSRLCQKHLLLCSKPRLHLPSHRRIVYSPLRKEGVGVGPDFHRTSQVSVDISPLRCDSSFI